MLTWKILSLRQRLSGKSTKNRGPDLAVLICMDPDLLNHVSFLTIQSAIQIHRELGPGLFESIYRACMIYELQQRGLKVVAEQFVPVCYRSQLFDCGFRSAH
jgi:hypothetical protein